MRQLLGMATVAIGVFLSASAAHGDTPPPGATAQCRDGSYSYAQTRSGTCSHHGGVADWLSGTTTSAATTTTSTSTTTSGTESSSAPPAESSSRSKPGSPSESSSTTTNSFGSAANLGHSVMLQSKTKSSGCTLGALPDRRCSPGAYSSGLTKAVICSASFHTGTVRNVPESEKHQVESEYGMTAKSYGSMLEIDHIVSLELGGSNDSANLFPEQATLPGGQPGYHIKDKLENKLHAMVCAGQISLSSAQQRIAANWETLYKQVFGVAP